MKLTERIHKAKKYKQLLDEHKHHLSDDAYDKQNAYYDSYIKSCESEIDKLKRKQKVIEMALWGILIIDLVACVIIYFSM